MHDLRSALRLSNLKDWFFFHRLEYIAPLSDVAMRRGCRNEHRLPTS
jgi:hypothetical protein